MSKRTRNKDNSKRQQPIQQQRAHARLAGKRDSASKASEANQPQPKQDERDTGAKR